MVCQSQSPIFHAGVMQQTYRHIRKLFQKTKMYTAVVPAYPGGLWSFTVGPKCFIDPEPGKVSHKNTQYVNEHMIERCFALPQFLQEQLTSTASLYRTNK